MSTSVGRARGWVCLPVWVGQAGGCVYQCGWGKRVGVSTSVGRARGWVCLPVWVGQEGGWVH